MKYDNETTIKLVSRYKELLAEEEVNPEKFAPPFQTVAKTVADEFSVPEKSVIAKLSSLGVYKRKEYRNKQGAVPVKKEEYVERIAILLGTNAELLESLEKVNKNVLKLLETALSHEKDE